MITPSIQQPEISKNPRTIVHSISLLLFPAILLIVMVFGNLTSGQFDFAYFVGNLVAVIFLTGYIAFLYYLAGGFDWRLEKLSVIRGILFFVLSGLLYGLILYGVWYLIRLIMAKIYNIPVQVMMGRLLATRQRTYTQKTENKNTQDSQSPNKLLRWAPIAAALISFGLVGGLGILLTPHDVYAQDVNTSPGKSIGAMALIVSLIVLFTTKRIIENKTVNISRNITSPETAAPSLPSALITPSDIGGSTVKESPPKVRIPKFEGKKASTGQLQGSETRRLNKINGYYWLILWIFCIVLGLVIPDTNLGPAWAGWTIFTLGIVGATTNSFNLFGNTPSPILILIEACDNFCLAALLAMLFFMTFDDGGEFTWGVAGLAIAEVLLGRVNYKKYRKWSQIASEPQKSLEVSTPPSAFVVPSAVEESAVKESQPQELKKSELSEEPIPLMEAKQSVDLSSTETPIPLKPKISHKNISLRKAVISGLLSGVVFLAVLGLGFWLGTNRSHGVSIPIQSHTSSPIPSPTAIGGGTGWIAFSDEINGNRDIYIIKTDGSAKIRLTSNEAYEWSPAWSPDGKQIAFLSVQEVNSDIYIMDFDGSNVRRLTNNQSYEGYPAWSPDRKSIVFVSDRDEPDPANCGNTSAGCNSNIYEIDIDTLKETRLTDSPSDEEGPTWSPDGAHIAFYSIRNGNAQIYMMDANGSNVTRLTNDLYYNWRPAWSPDGKQIAFMLYVNGTNQIYVMNTDGSNVTRLTNSQTDDSAPSWSPDGRHIAFQTSSSSYVNAKICIVDLNATNMTCLTNNLANAWEPAWQPLTTASNITLINNTVAVQLSTPATQTATQKPKSTPTPTPTSTPIPFVIHDKQFAASDYQNSEGNDKIWVEFKDGSMSFPVFKIPPEGLPYAFFGDGVTHTWIGKTELFGYIFNGDQDNPLKFRVTHDGYLYIGGKGSVTSPDGSIIQLGAGDASALPSTSGATLPTPITTDTPNFPPAQAEWNGIPIMPAAISGQEEMGDYQFTTTASSSEIKAYYERKMVDLGWELHPEMMASIPTDLAFKKGGLFVFFKIFPEGANNIVLIHIVQQ